MGKIERKQLFTDNPINPPEHFNRYRRGLTISSMLIVAILFGGLRFENVSAASVGLKITYPLGMHALVWSVFLYYLGAYWVMRRDILDQLDRYKKEANWPAYVAGLASRHFNADIDKASGRLLKNIELNYESTSDRECEVRGPGAYVTNHVDLALTDELRAKFLASGQFTESTRGANWLAHTYTITEEDFEEFDRRRGYALTQDKKVWLEYRLPYISAWLLLLFGAVVYFCFFFFPDSALGKLVPLGTLKPIQCCF